MARLPDPDRREMRRYFERRRFRAGQKVPVKGTYVNIDGGVVELPRGRRLPISTRAEMRWKLRAE